MKTTIELDEIALENVNGGFYAYPNNRNLRELGLGGMVRSTGGILDEYYDVWLADGSWRNVGSDDMLKLVKETLGANDPRYKALYAFCYDTSTHNQLIV